MSLLKRKAKKEKNPNDDVDNEVVDKKSLKKEKIEQKKREKKEAKEKKIQEKHQKKEDKKEKRVNKKEKKPREKKEKPPKVKKEGGSSKGKKILLVVAIFVLFVVVGIFVIGFMGSSNPPIINPDDTQHAVEAPPVEMPPVLQVPYYDIDLLTYSFDGEIWLYNTRGEELDYLDLKTLDYDYLDEFNERNKIEVAEDEDVDMPIDDVIVGEDIYEPEIIIGEDGEPMEVFSPKPEVVDEEIEENDELKTVDGDTVLTEEEDIIEITETPYILEESVDTEFVIFKNDGHNLFFGDIKRQSLLEVTYVGGEIRVNEIIRDILIDTVMSVASNEEEYLIAVADGIIIVGGDNSAYVLMDDFIGTNKDLKEYEKMPVELVGSKDKDIIFFTIDSVLFKIDLNRVGHKDAIRYIDLGDKIIGLFIYEEVVFVVNQFGFDVDNSILMKIEVDEDLSLIVDDLMELKGVYSRPIGIHNGRVYIRQSEFIREVDIESFKPERAFTRTAGIPMAMDKDFLFTIVDGELNVVNIGDRQNTIRTMEIEGDTLYIKGN